MLKKYGSAGIVWALGTLMVGALPLCAQAAAGANSGGGGAQIEAQFRLKGYELIAKIANNPLAGAYCPSDLLENTLDTTQIDVVTQLIDPSTGQPVTQLVDAWTTPNHVQLLQDSWQNLVGIHAQPFRVAQQVGVLVLHELYRATGSCSDEQFENSVRAYAVLSQSARSTFSEMWTFKYRYSDLVQTGYGHFALHSNGPSTYDVAVVCDQPVESIRAGSEINCLRVAVGETFFGTGILKKRTITHVETKSHPNRADETLFTLSNPNDMYSFDHPDEPVKVDEAQETVNRLKLVSPEHPFLVVHDIQNGTWHFMMQ